MNQQISGNGNRVAGEDYNETHHHFHIEHCSNCRVPLVKNEAEFCRPCRAYMEGQETLGNIVMVIVGSVMVLCLNANFAEFIGFTEHINAVAIALYPLECVLFIWLWLKLGSKL